MTAKFEVYLQKTHNPPTTSDMFEIDAQVETKTFVSNQQFPNLY